MLPGQVSDKREVKEEQARLWLFMMCSLDSGSGRGVYRVTSAENKEHALENTGPEKNC